MEDLNLIVKDVAISYDTFKLKDITFELNQGDIMGLIGGSGAGKSTIIKTLIGFKSQSTGTIRLTREDIEFDIKKELGYSPQQNSLYPFLSIKENIKIFAKLNNVKNKIIKKNTVELLKRLDLEKQGDKRINQLSGGMQKRADLAVSLIHSPKLIILDEPFAGLDVSLQKFIWVFLKELKQEGKIIIISSHMLHDIKENCNKFGLVYKGVFYGTDQIISAVKHDDTHNFEIFIEKVFESTIEK